MFSHEGHGREALDRKKQPLNTHTIFTSIICIFEESEYLLDMLRYLRLSCFILLLSSTLGSEVIFAWTGKTDPIKHPNSDLIQIGTGKNDTPKLLSGSFFSEDATGSFLGTKDESINTWEIVKIPEDARSSTDSSDKDARRNKIQEKKDIIKTLDEGIIKFLQPRDKKSFREIRKNYPDLNDQKSALLIFRSSLVQRYDAFDNKRNKLISDYYTGLFSEIDSQIEEINTALTQEKDNEKKNIFQSFIDSIFH